MTSLPQRITRGSLTLFAGVLIAVTAPANATEPNADRPNIVVFVADDMGWGDISASKDGKALYLYIFEWPKSGKVTLSGLSDSAAYLATGKKAKFPQQGTDLTLSLTASAQTRHITVVKLIL